MRGADGPPELFQAGRRIVALRDPGGLRIEQDTTAEFERAIEYRIVGLSPRYHNDAET